MQGVLKTIDMLGQHVLALEAEVERLHAENGQLNQRMIDSIVSDGDTESNAHQPRRSDAT